MPYREPEPHERKQNQPAYVEGPVPWEDRELPWLTRLFRTLNATFLPVETARAVAEGRVGPAALFAFLTALPWSLSWAIMPYSHTLLFKPSFGLERMEGASLSLESDLARTLLLSLGLSVISLLSWSIPFASLLRAFSRDPKDPQTTRGAYRNALYRVWVVPFGMTMFWMCVWAMPENTPSLLPAVTFLFFQIMPRMLIILHCHAMARYFGASLNGALLVSVVPLLVEWSVGLIVAHLTQGLLPAIPAALQGGAS